MSEELIVYGGTALTLNAELEIVESAVIRSRDGRITSITSERDFDPSRNKSAKIVDARGCLVMPGLVNGHTHTGMSLLRGIADDLPLHRWLNEKIFPLERQWGKPDFVYLGTLLGALEMIRSGTTTFNDMYYHEEYAAKAAHEAGLRCIAGQTIVEISGVQASNDLFRDFDKFLDEVSGYPLVYPAITPHSIYGVKPDTWKKIIEYAKHHQLRLHTHLAETREEEEECRKQFGKAPTEVFEDLGLFEVEKVIAAHGTCLGEKEIAILGKHRAAVVHNPESNLKLRTEICPVVELRQAGVSVALGTDGCASNNNLDLFQEADTAAKLQIFRKGVGELTAVDTVKLLTSEGARAMGLGDEIGSLEVGKGADLIAVDTRKPHATPLYHPYSHLIYSASGADVKHTVVNGRVLMENYRVLVLDEGAILDEARAMGARIAQSTR